jgi:hypothetical protein
VNEIPNWWEFVLLALAVFRIYRLIAEDTILDRPRRWLLRLGNEWQSDGDEIPPEYREKWALFITCPWCLGFWLSVLAWVGWLIFPTETIWLAVPWALSAVVALINKNLDPEEE